MIGKTTLTLVITAAMLVAAVGPASAAMFTDGDFEEAITGSGDRLSGYTFGAWTVGDSDKLGANGWTNTAHNDGAFTRAGSVSDATTGADSVTMLSGRPTGEIFQAFDTTIGTTYTVTFDAKERSSGSTQNLNVRVFDGLLPDVGAGFRSSIDLLDGAALGGENVTDVTSGWVTYSFDFTAISTTSTISLLAQDSSEKQITIDTVTVTEVVPEPASLALIALGGLLIARRRG